MRNFILALVLCGSVNPLCAQIIPAWTRQLTLANWAAIASLSASQVAKKQTYFLALERTLPATLQVKTTPDNLIKHKVFYSGLFSQREKEILLTPVYPKATLGKVAYMHDKHALFFEKMSVWNSPHIDLTAFTRHQGILRELLGALQTYYPQQFPQDFVSEVFSKEEILRLNTAPTQPSAYVLSSGELKEFAGLPTLLMQRIWVRKYLEYEQAVANSLLLKEAGELSAREFEHYYRAQRRISYLQLLSRVLEQSIGKRNSAIVRYKRTLPGENIPLTDAQRGGKLLLSRGEESQEYQAFKQEYAPYAAAEALQAPYEIALRYGSNAPELLGEEEGARLRKLEPQKCLEELTPKINSLQQEMQLLQTITQKDHALYVHYYRVYAQLKIYKTYF